MDRPKHRRLILIGGALLAAGVWLLLSRQWNTEPEPHPSAAEAPTSQLPESALDQADPAASAEAATAATTTKTAAPETGSFRGRVLDAVTRRPVPEFEIELVGLPRGPTHGNEPRVTQTFQSTDGRFVWQEAPAGTWNVTVAASRYQRFRIEKLNIETGKATREVLMRLQRGHTLKGRVFDQISGAGIADARVGFTDPSAGWRDPVQQRSEKTSAEGTFVLDGVPGGEMLVTAHAKDHASREIEVLVKEDTRPLDIALATGGKIAGMVLAADGTPAKGHLMLSGPGMPFVKPLDETGGFSFEHRPAGHYVLNVSTPSGVAGQELDLSENEFREDIVLRIEAGRSVRGVVRGLRPEQLARTHVTVQPLDGPGGMSARLDERGAYAVHGVPPGLALLIAHADKSRQIRKRIDMKVDQDVTVDLVFPPGVRLSGRVTRSAKPVADLHMWVGPTDDNSETLYRTQTAQDGHYEIEDVEPGEYRISVGDNASRIVTIAGDTTVNIDIPVVQIGGSVVEEGAGAIPIVDAQVFVTGVGKATSRVRASRTTNHFGQFTLVGLEPGEVLLTVYKPGYELYRERITYGSPITNKQIKLGPGSGVEIRVQRPAEGPPIHGFTLLESPDEGTAWSVQLWIPLDRDGIGRIPIALAGSTLYLVQLGEESITIKKWDGQPLDVKL